MRFSCSIAYILAVRDELRPALAELSAIRKLPTGAVEHARVGS